jgi:methylated-DNA-[protein]-cysteine S-methyltransferase
METNMETTMKTATNANTDTDATTRTSTSKGAGAMTSSTIDMTFHRTTMPSPIGTLTIVANDHAVVAIDWDGGSAHESTLGDAEIVDVAPADHPPLASAVEQLTEYFDGERIEFDLPLDAGGTPFQHQAWDALVRIPFGETVSYGEQAVMLGDKNKARAVGAANGRNPIPIVVPCHRVVGSNGHLTGFAGGLEVKAWLLDHEFKVRAAATNAD